MDFSEISISTIKNSTEFGSDFTKIFELKNSDQKDSPEKNTELIEFSRSNSILLFIYQKKEAPYIQCKKQKRYYDKFFHDKSIEKIYLNFVLYKNFINNKFFCRKKTSVNNCTKNINKKKNVNKNINSNEKINSMTTRDSSELLSSKKKNNILDIANSKKNYSKYYPKETEWKTKPPQKPLSFPIQTYLGLNKEKNEIGSKEFLDLNENIFFSENGSYKIINPKGHELLNHFLRKDFKTNSICFRYRHKNATFVYYK